MAQNIPVDLTGTFVGRREGREYVQKTTGELKPAIPTLKFLVEFDGDAELLEIWAASLDRTTPPLDYAGLAQGDRVHFRGTVVLHDRGSGKDSFISFTTAEVVGAAVAKPKAA